MRKYEGAVARASVATICTLLVVVSGQKLYANTNHNH